MNGYIYKMQIEHFLATATFEQAQARADELWTESDAASRALNDFTTQYPSGPMNLTPDYVRAMPEYQELRRTSQIAVEKLQTFNAVFTKKFKKEIRAHIAAKREAKMRAASENNPV